MGAMMLPSHMGRALVLMMMVFEVVRGHPGLQVVGDHYMNEEHHILKDHGLCFESIDHHIKQCYVGSRGINLNESMSGFGTRVDLVALQYLEEPVELECEQGVQTTAYASSFDMKELNGNGGADAFGACEKRALVRRVAWQSMAGMNIDWPQDVSGPLVVFEEYSGWTYLSGLATMNRFFVISSCSECISLLMSLFSGPWGAEGIPWATPRTTDTVK